MAPERPLPKKRSGCTYEVEIYGAAGRVKMYLRTGLYADGTLGEIFLDVAKFGSDLRSMLSSWAILFSIALQGGVSVHRLVRTFRGVPFEPKGRVVCSLGQVTKCSSILDVVCQILEAEFLENCDK